MTVAISSTNLTKDYKTVKAVDGININIPSGVCCGFLGKNGAGKTTTIRMLAGLLQPTNGNIKILDQDLVFGKSFSASFGYLPDVPNFYGYMTGREFLHLCGKICDMPEKTLKPRIAELLSLVGLDTARSKISGYSRGMKQRLGIAQAMINSPELILMDEPISALDPIGRRDVSDIIRKMTGTTVILSTHILADVEDICDYVLIIEKGKLLAQDFLANLKEKYSSGAIKIRFYDNTDSEKFIGNLQGFHVTKDKVNPLEIVLKHDNLDSKEAGQLVVRNLTEMNIPCRYFGAHTPTLEDIFYEVTENA